MKKILFVLMAALAFVACQKGNEDEPNQPHYTKCELTPMQITVPAEGGTFTVKTNTPAYVAMFGAKDANRIYEDVGFAAGIQQGIPLTFPIIYEPTKKIIPSSYFETFEGTYYIEQVNATTFNITVLPPKGYSDMIFAFLPEGGANFGQALNIKIE